MTITETHHRLPGSPAPVLPATTLAALLEEAGAALDALTTPQLTHRAATVDALAGELAVAAGLPALAGANSSPALSLRTIATIAARTVGRPVPVGPERAAVIRTIVDQL